MRFFVRRASERDEEAAPCPEATLDDGGDWTVDIPNLDSLELFVKGYGEVVLREPTLQTGDHLELFIYDEYIE